MLSSAHAVRTSTMIPLASYGVAAFRKQHDDEEPQGARAHDATSFALT
jgi:hypothetical protein